MRFDPEYSEEVSLRDGTRVTLRLIRPGDASGLRRGFDRLSPVSRYRRFLTAKESLSDRELEYLTRVDGLRHFALLALRRAEGGEEEGVGVARFVETSLGVAEPAVVVIDELQGKGLGRALLERLHDAAVERGITRFRAEVLATNTPMRAIFELLGPSATITEEGGGILRVEIALTGPGGSPLPEPPHGVLYRFLTLAARGAFTLRGVLKQAVNGGKPGGRQTPE